VKYLIMWHRTLDFILSGYVTLFNTMSIICLLSIVKQYPELSNKAFNVLLPFTSTVLVERAFSSYTYIKNKYLNRLSESSDSSKEPDFKKICVSKQAQGWRVSLNFKVYNTYIYIIKLINKYYFQIFHHWTYFIIFYLCCVWMYNKLTFGGA